MARFSPISALVRCVFAAQFVAGVAAAHIHLLEPQPRYPDEVSGENKNCPCGVGTGGRGCTKPEERSDPNRSMDRATALLGGSMLTVELDEYIGHSGRYRIAFDPEGADLEDFNQYVLADIPDPRGNRGNTGNDSLWEIAAPLPNIDCDNCTLQVIQMMNGEMVDPVDDPVGKSSYYQCADLTLTRDPSKPDGYPAPIVVLGEAMGMAGAGASEEMPAGRMGIQGGTAGATSPTLAPMMMATTGSAAPAMGAGADSGGCSVSAAPVGNTGSLLGVAGAALLYGTRRRRRR